MKYLKFSSLLVLSLLLFAPSVLAQVECEVRPSNQRIRMESEMEMINSLTVRCEYATATNITASTSSTSLLAARETANESSFDLALQFNGDLLNDDGDDAKMAVTLWLMDDAASTATPPVAATAEVDTKGNRIPAPMGTVDRDTVYWEDVLFPGAWDGGAETFTVAGIYVDATSISGDRLEVSGEMIGYNLGNSATLDMDKDAVSLARVDQAMDLSLAEDQKAQSFNACEPGKKMINVTIEEGYRMAWDDMNDIKLMTSSGGIKAKDVGTIFDVTAEGAAGELIIDVNPTASDDTADIAIEFAPAAGGTVGDDITLTAMILPARRSKESFAASATLVVGTYSACEGDSLFFPFVTSMSGWDTGIVVVNDSAVDGSCSLNWGNMDLDDDEMAALSTIDVDAKDHMAFLVSGQRGADYSGSVGVSCSFSSATGYVFLSDSANGIGQGYLVNP